MGAWGTGPFENDTAADWWAEFEPGSVEGVFEVVLAAGKGGELVDAPVADEALAAITLVALAMDPALPSEWGPGDVADLTTVLPNAHDLASLAAACVPIIARSESAELWEGDQDWWGILRKLAMAVGCPESELEGLGPKPFPTKEVPICTLAPEERESLLRRGHAALTQMRDSARANDRETFDIGQGTFFYCATQLNPNPNAPQSYRERSLEQWLQVVPETDHVWEHARSQDFGSLLKAFERMLTNAKWYGFRM